MGKTNKSRTQELRKNIVAAIDDNCRANWFEEVDGIPEAADAILEACRECGLEFVIVGKDGRERVWEIDNGDTNGNEENQV